MPRDGLVPVDVPAAPRSRDSRRNTPRYLTPTDSGWRFQMRLPIEAPLSARDSEPAATRLTLRASLGERPRLDAERTAQRLATLCRAVCGLVHRGDRDMQATTMTAHQTDLVASVIAACQEAIARALAEPSEAIGLAKGLQGALDTLRLVESEVGKGSGGIAAIVDGAEALTRGALDETLRLAADPAAGLATLAAVPVVAPNPPARPTPGNGLRLPTFGEVSQAYIDARRRSAPGDKDHADIQYLVLRRQTFLDVVGDKPVDQYYPTDLQAYVDKMQFWPANVTKRASESHLSTNEILAGNRSFSKRNMKLKTMKDGYVANIRTMMRHGMADHRYRDPFAGADIRYPKTLGAPVEREAIDSVILDRVFCEGVASGFLDEAMLPLLATLTSRRLGLLVHLRGVDIRSKHGVWVARVNDRILVDGSWMTVPIKTDESNHFFVLHRFFEDIGFIDWARGKPGFLFEEAHEHTDPAKYVSKNMNRLLRRSGAAGGNMEVFHSLRGDSIQMMRDDEVSSRTTRKQAGHDLGDVHEGYGHKSLQANECLRLFYLPLLNGIEWKVFKGLDFGRMSAQRRTRGRPAR